MRFLLCSDHYSAVMSAIAEHVSRFSDATIFYATGRQKGALDIPGVHRVILKKKRATFAEDRYDLVWSEAIRTGQSALFSFKQLFQNGFSPDIVFASDTTGMSFFLRQAFAPAFICNYSEPDGDSQPGEVSRAIRDIQARQIMQSDLSFVASQAVKNLYPQILHEKIAILPPTVNREFYSPANALPYNCWKFKEGPKTVIVFNLTQLAEERENGFLPLAAILLGDDPRLHIVFLLASRSRVMRFANALTRFSLPVQERLFALAPPEPATNRDLLASALLIIYPNPSGILTPFILQSMSCAGLLVTQSRASDLLIPNVNMLEMPHFDELGQMLPELLRSIGKFGEIRQNARMSVLDHYDQSLHLPGHIERIFKAYEARKKTGT